MATYWENSCSFGLRYVSWYKYLIVSLVFSHLGFWSGNLFLIAPFPDLCLLVPFHSLDKSDDINLTIKLKNWQCVSLKIRILSMQYSFWLEVAFIIVCHAHGTDFHCNCMRQLYSVIQIATVGFI